MLVFAILLLSLIILMEFRETIRRSITGVHYEKARLVSEKRGSLRVVTRDSAEAPPLLLMDQRHAPFFFMPIAINEASEELLTTIPGIGPAIAARIVEFRTEKGRVENIDQLISVNGVGPKKLERIKPHLAVQ